MLEDATAREQLAALAMQGMLSADSTGIYANMHPAQLARAAFDVAEAMLHETRRRDGINGKCLDPDCPWGCRTDNSGERL